MPRYSVETIEAMQKHLLGYRDNLRVEVGPGFACGGGTLVGRQTWNRAKLLVRMAQLFSAIAPSVSIYETVVGPTPMPLKPTSRSKIVLVVVNTLKDQAESHVVEQSSTATAVAGLQSR